METETRYCSIDLELTGFDPTRDEILEVGFVFFTLGANGVHILEEWTQVFAPSRPVHPKILGLTGISQVELDAAPKFLDFHDELQEKLRDVILVGHNIVLDIRFLEAFGITLSGQSIDTLELVQWILPTHHSYNLENLMHTLQLPKTAMHRALADSVATARLLERLLAIYQSYSEQLKSKIGDLLQGTDMLWASLLGVSLQPWTPPETKVAATPEAKSEILELPSHSVVVLPLAQTFNQRVLESLREQNKPAVYVAASTGESLALWKHGLAAAAFPPEDSFSETKFLSWLSSPNHSREEVLFLLKILVWRYTNWQHETVLDLNISFSGGQFRGFVTGRETQTLPKGKLLCTDPQTFFDLAKARLFHKDFVVVNKVSRFEEVLVSTLGGRASWNKIIRSLRSLYDPETATGVSEAKAKVLDLLAATDLFFGIALTVIGKLFPQGGYVKQEDFAKHSYEYQRLLVAAEHFVEKIRTFNSDYNLTPLAKAASALEEFFSDGPNQVRWVEFSDTACVFTTRPLDISNEVQTLVSSLGSLMFVDNAVCPEPLEFLLRRLGLSYQLRFEAFPVHRPRVVLHQGVPQQSEVREQLSVKHLPAAVVFPQLSEVKSFYDDNYQEVKQYAHIFAERYSGGSTKIINNFAHNSQSILLATPAFLLRAKDKTIRVRTLVLAGLGKKRNTHPYQLALERAWFKDFENFNELFELRELETLLSMFFSKSLETINVYHTNSSPLIEQFFTAVGELETNNA